MAHRAVTISDVAREVGVSKSAVSVALSGKRSTIVLPDATRERILAAARRLNYTPSIIARSMVHQQTFLLGLLLWDVNTGLASELIRGVQETAVRRGYAPIVLSHSNSEEEIANLRTCIERRVDGLILTTVLDPDQAFVERQVEQLEKAGVPMVEVFGRTHSPWAVLDYRASGRIATEYLLAQGHRRIALLTHDEYQKGRAPDGEHWNAWEHYLGYATSIEAEGLTPQVITHPLSNEPRQEFGWVERACDAISHELGKPDRPTAVICYDDRQAYGVVRACRQMNLAIPRQLSVVGHLDLEMSRLLHPTLTTMRVPARQVGRQAAQMLFDQMEQRVVSSVSLEPELIVRESTAPPIEQ